MWWKVMYIKCLQSVNVGSLSTRRGWGQGVHWFGRHLFATDEYRLPRILCQCVPALDCLQNSLSHVPQLVWHQHTACKEKYYSSIFSHNLHNSNIMSVIVKFCNLWLPLTAQMIHVNKTWPVLYGICHYLTCRTRFKKIFWN